MKLEPAQGTFLRGCLGTGLADFKTVEINMIEGKFWPELMNESAIGDPQRQL